MRQQGMVTTAMKSLYKQVTGEQGEIRYYGHDSKGKDQGKKSDSHVGGEERDISSNTLQSLDVPRDTIHHSSIYVNNNNPSLFLSFTTFTQKFCKHFLFLQSELRSEFKLLYLAVTEQ
jgi:hypothetical protein